MSGSRRYRGLLSRFQHPAQVVVTGFGVAVTLGTLLLRLPLAAADREPTPWVDALFTATSAVCVTGLVTLDTGTHWSAFGKVVILGLIQVGGLGIMTMATLFAVLISGRLGLRARMAMQTESKTLSMSDVRRVGRNVVLFSLVSEVVVATILVVRLLVRYDEPVGEALAYGVFHGVSAFNNAGFVLWPDALTRFVGDPWMSLTIAGAVIVGGLGFPVIFELLRSWRRPRAWSVLTRITVVATVTLLVAGTFTLLMIERVNPATFGPLEGQHKLLAAFFAAVMPRSGGMNTVDLSQMTHESWLVMDILMFIGGGSASTAGGIKVTTFGLLAFVVWAELRGEGSVNVGRRRVPNSVQRQAITIALLAAGLVAVSTSVLLILMPHPLDEVLFEVISATCTVGLSTGITGELPDVARVLMSMLMFIGRIGPLTLGSALALRESTRHYELPEERPIVG